MGLLKAVLLGLVAAIAIATLAHGERSVLGDIARWHSIHLPVEQIDLHLSLPIFFGVTLFALAFFFFSRD